MSKQIKGFHGIIVFNDADDTYHVYFSLGEEVVDENGDVLSDSFGVFDHEIFYYTTWDEVPSLFFGVEDFTLLSIDSVSIHHFNIHEEVAR